MVPTATHVCPKIVRRCTARAYVQRLLQNMRAECGSLVYAQPGGGWSSMFLTVIRYNSSNFAQMSASVGGTFLGAFAKLPNDDTK